MSSPENKENFAPLTASDSVQNAKTISPRKAGRKGRSKSIGPGGIDQVVDSIDAASSEVKHPKNRRKSAFVSAVKSILPTKEDEAKRKAERRKSLANRRVSFAPEATLHTWDVIEYMRDHTTSTESSDSTRRASHLTRDETPQKASPAASSDDAGPPSTPPEQEDEPAVIPSSPAPQRELHQKKSRRSSGIPPMNFNNPEEASSPSGTSGSSDVSDGESDDEAISEEEATGTAMSLGMGDSTGSSDGSGSSTSSSARLEAALRQAADAAGTRGIEYDEHGEMSMELASEEVANAFQTSAQRHNNATVGSASEDQENVNPFSPAFKFHMASGTVHHPPTVQEGEEDEDISMDVTRAVGGIVDRLEGDEAPSPEGENVTMEFTQAFGKVQDKQQPQKRRRTISEVGSPAVTRIKRRRSSTARSSMGDETMDLTVAFGGIQRASSPVKAARRKSVAKRHSLGTTLGSDDATMDLTMVVGGIKATGRESAASIDEEFSMELTAALGGIREGLQLDVTRESATPQGAVNEVLSTSLATDAVKSQESFIDVQNSGPVKLLTPVFQKQVELSSRKPSGARSRSTSPNKAQSPGRISMSSPKTPGEKQSPLFASNESPQSGHIITGSYLRRQLDAQLQEQDVRQGVSPILLKQGRGSPMRSLSTPQQVTPKNPALDQKLSRPTTPLDTPTRCSPPKTGPSVVENIKLLSTPRKEILKTVTPSKPTSGKATTPRQGLTPGSTRNAKTALGSPARKLSDDLERLKFNGALPRNIPLQDFFNEAGIRFMDLNTTSRRMTTAPTPSRLKKASELADDEAQISLLSGVTAGACTAPELEMYSHACRELRRYLSEGKSHIKKLEQQTSRETPPLIQAYMSADDDGRADIDTHLREMKTQARYRSKEMWYSWRGQLLEDLMKGLQGIGENLIRDDEILHEAEVRVEERLPFLLDQQENLKVEAGKLERSAASISDEEKAELHIARQSLGSVNDEIEKQRQLLFDLQQQVVEREVIVANLQDNKTECSQAIQEADHVRETCRGVSLNEIARLKESISLLEDSHGWTITSATSSPPSVTMTYKQHLHLYFHPASFRQGGDEELEKPNTPISLTHNGPTAISTTLRFFLQLLQSSVHGLLQCKTRLIDMLSLISTGWDTALEVSEAERRLRIEGMTDAHIVDDGRLGISAIILLPNVKTKVKAVFELVASIGEHLDFSTSVEISVQVVYGEMYKEDGMTKFINDRIVGHDHWHAAVRELKARLMAQGPKGKRRL